MMIRRQLAAAALAATTIALLTACFFGPPAPSTGGGTGGDGQSGQTDDTTDGEVPGDVDLDELQGLPNGFPSDEVPIVDGDIPIGVDLGTGWSVIVKVSDIEASFTEASTLLKNAGFEAVMENASPEGSFGAFTGEKYTIQLTATDSPDYGPSVSYVVVING